MQKLTFDSSGEALFNAAMNDKIFIEKLVQNNIIESGETDFEETEKMVMAATYQGFLIAIKALAS